MTAGRSAPRCTAGLSIAIALVAGACSLERLVSRAGLPGTWTPATVQRLGERAGYLDAVVETGGDTLRFFFPDDPDCRATLALTQGLRYAYSGPLGRLRGDGLECDPVGVLSLEAWRNRAPRAARAPLLRSTARYAVFYGDEQMLLARGRFELAGIVGIAGADAVAAIPNVPECTGISRRTEATLEYRERGRPPFVLLDGERRCPLLGFALPQPGTPRSR